MVAAMIPANIFLIPMFYGMPRQVVVDMIGWIVLFNVLKAGGSTRFDRARIQAHLRIDKGGSFGIREVDGEGGLQGDLEVTG